MIQHKSPSCLSLIALVTSEKENVLVLDSLFECYKHRTFSVVGKNMNIIDFGQYQFISFHLGLE